MFSEFELTTIDMSVDNMIKNVRTSLYVKAVDRERIIAALQRVKQLVSEIRIAEQREMVRRTAQAMSEIRATATGEFPPIELPDMTVKPIIDEATRLKIDQLFKEKLPHIWCDTPIE